jgi:peptide/nickel transport system substrate-binding protein
MSWNRDTMLKVGGRVTIVTLAICTCTGCGPNGNGANTSQRRSRRSGHSSMVARKRGGTLIVLSARGPRTLDPGAARSDVAAETVHATQRPLFSYTPGDLGEPRPDLASGPAVFSANAEVVTVHIRPGVDFSPPVNREVTSADVAYAIERAANPHISNPDFRTYFSSLEGFDQARGGPIPGITTPGRYTIVFNLTQPRAAIVRDALALPLSAPVPESYAKQFDANEPSQYGDYQVATGPYMFKANRRGQVLGIGYRPGKSATLVRNPNWRSAADFRPAYLNEIDFRIGGRAKSIGQRVLKGTDAVQDGRPADVIIRLASEHYRSQLLISPSGGSRYVAVDNKHGPFANSDVRRALWAALNRNAMDKVSGGSSIARLATHFLYPGIPGSGRADSLVANPKPSYTVRPEGSALVAERYMRHAGYSTGHYTGGRTIRVVGSSSVWGRGEATIVYRTLRQLGFKVRLTLASTSVMYTKYCDVPAAEIDVCPDVGWRTDVSDGQAVLDPAFNGRTISRRGDDNWGQVDVPGINAAIEREAALTNGEGREEGWAAVDNGLVRDAVAIPYAWISEPQIESKDVVGAADASRGWDFSFTSLR